ncbi:addiction module toxin RelE [Duganella sp. FT80W]|uniref:Addiction module toxin RelE n=1 Tax=Duganella guangzhouensis TaxID=2666084 RepID=A0A6I2L1C5_9BURK|nr:transposase [Duganella guangzhouensis]MRW91988.1 addiction module toxin RelE [Duganella guangzhouensis]
MTRPLRIEFPGALYHVTSRGNRKAALYRDDTDRAVWLQTLANVCSRFNFSIHAFCQMGNHYHLLVETWDGHLGKGMRQLNGVYSQYFNRRHELVGHVFQGRYQAILVDKESYLLELARYIVLNPVRAGLVERPEQWRWSSYNLTTSRHPPPEWLEIDWLLAKFGPPQAETIEAYRHFVYAGIGATSPLANTYRQLILGSEEFIKRLQLPNCPPAGAGINKTHRSSLALPLLSYQQNFQDRDTAMAEAYRSNAYSMSEIARHFGVCAATVSRAVKKRG